MATGFANHDRERSLGSPTTSWVNALSHYTRLFVDLETLKPELTKILTSSIKVTHSVISQHFDKRGLLLKLLFGR